MRNYLVVQVALLVLFCCTAAGAGDYRYVKQETFKNWLASGTPVVVVDIQLPTQFAKHHFKGAIETGAFPANSDADRKKLDAVLPAIREGRGDVVIVCPRGGGGAKNTFTYLKEQGVAESRLLILEKGMDGWPYPEMTVSGR